MTEDAHTKSDSYRVRHTVPDQAPRTKGRYYGAATIHVGFSSGHHSWASILTNDDFTGTQ